MGCKLRICRILISKERPLNKSLRGSLPFLEVTVISSISIKGLKGCHSVSLRIISEFNDNKKLFENKVNKLNNYLQKNIESNENIILKEMCRTMQKLDQIIMDIEIV